MNKTYVAKTTIHIVCQEDGQRIGTLETVCQYPREFAAVKDNKILVHKDLRLWATILFAGTAPTSKTDEKPTVHIEAEFELPENETVPSMVEKLRALGWK